MGKTFSSSFSSEKYYNEANEMLQKKDLLGFASKLTVAIEIAQNAIDESDKELLGKATHLMVKGLMNFKKHREVLEHVDIAEKYNSGENIFELLNWRGLANGYLGNIDASLKIFKQLLEETEYRDYVKTCLHIVWVKLSLEKPIDDENLKEAFYYLEKASKHLDTYSEIWRFYNNYSVYYFHRGEYEASIEMLEKALECCDERNLPYVYTNLAEVHLKYDGDGVSEEISEYLKQAEVIANRYNDNMLMARAFFIRALLEIKEDRILSALDSLYLAFEHYKDAEAYPLAFDCLLKINELLNNYKIEHIKALRDSIEDNFKGTPYYKK